MVDSGRLPRVEIRAIYSSRWSKASCFRYFALSNRRITAYSRAEPPSCQGPVATGCVVRPIVYCYDNWVRRVVSPLAFTTNIGAIRAIFAVGGGSSRTFPLTTVSKIRKTDLRDAIAATLRAEGNIASGGPWPASCTSTRSHVTTCRQRTSGPNS